MTQRFILDENIVICGQLGTDAKGELDLTCSELVTRIIRICHPMVLDYNLRERHLRQLNRPRHQVPQLGPLFLRTLTTAYERADKAEIKLTGGTFALLVLFKGIDRQVIRGEFLLCNQCEQPTQDMLAVGQLAVDELAIYAFEKDEKGE